MGCGWSGVCTHFSVASLALVVHQQCFHFCDITVMQRSAAKRADTAVVPLADNAQRVHSNSQASTSGSQPSTQALHDTLQNMVLGKSSVTSGKSPFIIIHTHLARGPVKVRTRATQDNPVLKLLVSFASQIWCINALAESLLHFFLHTRFKRKTSRIVYATWWQFTATHANAHP